MNFFSRFLACFIVISACSFISSANPKSLPTLSPWQESIIQLAGVHSGIYVEDQQGNPLFDYNASSLFIPASVAKLGTTAAALHYLTPDYRFKTEIFWESASRTLAIKGYGNPLFFTEDMIELAAQLKEKNIQKINHLLLDTTYFAPSISIPNQRASDNPADQTTGAIWVDFNVANIRRDQRGLIQSVNPLTPITPSVALAAKRFKRAGTYQISMTQSETSVLRYFADLLQLILKENGIQSTNTFSVKAVPASFTKLITLNSRENLRSIAAGILKYSTNSSANQLFLTLGAHLFGAPATLEKGQQALNQFLRDVIGISGFTIVEGSGLARENQFTPKDITAILAYLTQYREIMPMKDGFLAKTGTIRNVATLAGFFDSKSHGVVRFAILLNGLNGYPNQGQKDRLKIAKILNDNL